MFGSPTQFFRIILCPLAFRYNVVGKYMASKYPQYFAGIMTYERFLWAHLIIETRAFSCPSSSYDQPSSTWCLVPFMDLINHQSYVGSEYGVDTYAKGLFRALVMEAYEPGAEMYISYGSHHHTAHFLETYVLSNALFARDT